MVITLPIQSVEVVASATNGQVLRTSIAANSAYRRIARDVRHSVKAGDGDIRVSCARREDSDRDLEQS